MMESTIRIASSGDYHQISRLVAQIQAIHAETRPDIFNIDPCPLKSDYYQKLLQDPQSKVFVAEHEGTIIAYAIIRIHVAPQRSIYRNRKFISVDDLCVDEAFRGLGTGRHLLEYIFHYAKENGSESVELGVLEFNTEAIRFYESMGMQTRSRRMEIRLKDFE
ncbi:GNAT family N-acetyltransferase [Paenibacillus sp. Marseille-Q4541]|uniref:GNAT family N-acetyltransferase n=1 Tax=Paenibacillus sp. Marseille-Q4541 TaxID=2831522 RepID=UPI001BAD1AE6|nr:GNAT family N-acetyltransferase [Paenibacillus sp. Marseille-Q4541]